MSDVLLVVAAWLTRADGHVLLAQRQIGKAYASCYEFPGGKVQPGESEQAAMARELREELGLSVQVHELLSQSLEDQRAFENGQIVRLQLYRVSALEADLQRLGPVGLEGQALRFCPPGRLQRLDLPPLDRPLVRDLALARQLVISPEPNEAGEFLRGLKATVSAGNRIVLLRAKQRSLPDLRSLVVKARDILAAAGGELLIQDRADLVQEWRLGGMSLTAKALMQQKKRPLPENYWLVAACHNEQELHHAHAIGCDFVTLAPVLPTTTHPGQTGMGWAAFAGLAQQFSDLPIYALGGLNPADLAKAQQQGAFGVAGISEFWTPGTLNSSASRR